MTLNFFKKKKFSSGFTLIELIVVFSVIAVISTVGVVSFTSYNKTSELNSAVSDTISFLNSAKSNSLSQIVPEECDVQGLALEGYEVRILSGGQNQSSIELWAKCASSYFMSKTLTLSSNIAITAPVSPDNIFFYPLFSKEVSGGQICLEGFDLEKAVNVSSLGTVTIDNACQ